MSNKNQTWTQPIPLREGNVKKGGVNQPPKTPPPPPPSGQSPKKVKVEFNLKEKKTTFEQEMCNVIYPKLIDFREETGICINSMDVNFIKVGVVGKKDKYILVGVDCKLDI